MARPQALQLELFSKTPDRRPDETSDSEPPLTSKLRPRSTPKPRPRPRSRLDPAEVGPSRSAPSPLEAGLLLQRLSELMPGRLGSITLTDNRSSIVSAREKHGKLDLRIHRSFASAPAETLSAVATFLRSERRSAARRAALATIRAYFRDHSPQTSRGPRRPRRIILRPVGHTLDLRQVRDAVNSRYFGGELSVHITWGRAPSRSKRRKGCGFSVRLGTYSERDNVIRIHPCLDDKIVPRYVVEAVVHHELLHAAIPAVVVNGRRRVHTPEFRRREKLFRHYHKAERWIDRHLARLIGAR